MAARLRSDVAYIMGGPSRSSAGDHDDGHSRTDERVPPRLGGLLGGALGLPFLLLASAAALSQQPQASDPTRNLTPVTDQTLLNPPDGDWLGTPYLTFHRDGPFAVVTLDRPEARNAMTPAMYFGITCAPRRIAR